MQVPEPGMPDPGFFFPLSRKADRLCEVDVEHIEPSWSTVDLGKQAAPFVAYAHHAILHQHLIPPLVELANRNDVGGELGKVVYVGEGAMFPCLTGQEHDSDPFYVCHRPIPEADGAGDAGVEVGECHG